MLSNWIFWLCQLAAVLPSLANAQYVFAHVIVGNNGAYTEDSWKGDIRLAHSKGIDAFVLNIGTPYQGTTATQMSYAFLAANALRDDEAIDFKLFFSFDYNGGSATPPAWPIDDVISILQDYAPNGAYFQYDGRPLVSTFEGPANAENWTTIRASVDGGIYFVPDWTSLGTTNGQFDLDLVDGAFSWDMWPNGPADINTTSDVAWDNEFLRPAGKTYMMGVSPWFYTDLPQYDKAWVWRGDKSWSIRWDQTHVMRPEFVQIVTWNDYGESHYVGPIVESGIPSGAGAYVEGYPHIGWLETLPYEIAAYKHACNSAEAAPSVASGEDRMVYWYRTSPASAGTSEVTGNNCYSSVNHYGYQNCYSVSDILEDAIFVVVLASSPGSVTISIGGMTFDPVSVSAGKTFITQAFNGATGTVSVSMGSISGSGADITAQPAGGTANYNAWVWCAGHCNATV